MIVERITPVSLDNNQAAEYAQKAAKEYCDKKITAYKYLGGGSFGKAVRITFEDKSSIVVKFLRAKGMLEKEVHDLCLIGKHCKIKMPKVYFARQSDAKIPVDCYGMEVIEGKPLIYDFAMYLKSKKRKIQLAEKIAEGLHSIHECTNDKFGDTLAPEYDSWIECYKSFAKQVLDKAIKLYEKGELSFKIVDTMKKAWQKFDIIFEEKVEKACLIHGDLNVVNIMVDKNHEPSGFIDPLNSMYADREYDLFQFYNLTGKNFYLGKIYRQKYGESKRFDDKMAFYGLWNEVYCVIKSGILVGFIMNPLVRNMKRRIKNL